MNMNNMNLAELLKLMAPILIIELVLIVVALRSVIKDKVNYLPKWAWVLIILFFQTLGPIVYLIVGRKKD